MRIRISGLRVRWDTFCVAIGHHSLAADHEGRTWLLLAATSSVGDKNSK